MYERNTILTLKQPRDPDPETNEEFPYNRVRVVGPSPISHGGAGEWEGVNAAGVIITPESNFGATLDEPYGKLVALYDVSEIPEPLEIEAPKIRVINSTSQSAGPTPEEQFAVLAPGVAPEEGQRRGRTRPSPLDDPRPAASDGPLGPVPASEDE
jgi:hypothetical protein